MRNSYAFLFFVSLLLLAPGTSADVVYLKNGDRISGTLVRKSLDRLVIRTPYAGEVTIAWNEVDSFTTEKAVRLYFEESGLTTALVQKDDAGQQVMIEEGAETGTPLELESLAYINPPKHVTGEGFTWSGNLNLGLTHERGNTDKDDYHLDGEIRVLGKGERYRLFGEFDRERSDNRTIKTQWKAIGDYNRDLVDKWYLFTNLFTEGDTKKDLEIRATASVGPGYRVFDSEELNLSLEAGPGITIERWDNETEEDDEYWSARWGVNYDHYVYRRFVQLFHKQNGVWNLETTSDYVLTTRSGVNFDLTKNLRSTVGFNYEYDNGAPRDRDKSDKKLFTTIGYKW